MQESLKLRREARSASANFVKQIFDTAHEIVYNQRMHWIQQETLHYDTLNRIDNISTAAHQLANSHDRRDFVAVCNNLRSLWNTLDRMAVDCRRTNRVSSTYTRLYEEITQTLPKLEQRLTWLRLRQ